MATWRQLRRSILRAQNRLEYKTRNRRQDGKFKTRPTRSVRRDANKIPTRRHKVKVPVDKVLDQP